MLRRKKISNMKDINGTKIRELLMQKRNVPEYLIDKDYRFIYVGRGQR